PRLMARGRHAAGGMQQPVVTAEEVTAGDVEVRAINEPAILPDQALALLAVAGGKIVPGDARRFVVQRMQVVEEEEGPEDPRALDDGDALADAGPRAMLRERADELDGIRRHHHRHEVEPERNAADDLQPEDDGDAPEEMLGPDGPDSGLAAPDIAKIPAQVHGDAQPGPDDEAPGQGLLQAQGGAHEGAQSPPALLRPVPRLRIVDGIGQPRIVMMLVMQVAITLIGNPQLERNDREQPV